MIGIYKITNLQNGKCYVGQSINIEGRFKQHRYCSTQTSHQHLPLYAAMVKYGCDNFSYDILEECALDDLNSREEYWADYLNSYVPNGYNVRHCGDNSYCGSKLQLDDVMQIIQLLRETELSQTEIGYLFNVGWKFIQLINVGKAWHIADQYPIRTRYWYKKDKIAHNVSDERANKILSIYNTIELLLKDIVENGFEDIYNRTHIAIKTYKAFLKDCGLPATKKEIKQYYETTILGIIKTQKIFASGRVQQYDLSGNLVAEYASGHDAGRYTGISRQHINDVCAGKRKTAGGFVWKRIT